MHLTPDTLRLAYEYLKTTSPFNRWHLPDGDSISWHVRRDKTIAADCGVVTGADEYEIGVSTFYVGTTGALMPLMGHEMAHLYLARRKMKNWHSHGKEFSRLADRICKSHGFDRKMF